VLYDGNLVWLNRLEHPFLFGCVAAVAFGVGACELIATHWLRVLVAAVTTIVAGAWSTIGLWTAANRDPQVFGDPDEFRPEENAHHNMVFGVGPHLCPGRCLTLMELRVAVSELLARTERLLPAGEAPVRERAPVSGWARVPVVLA